MAGYFSCVLDLAILSFAFVQHGVRMMECLGSDFEVFTRRKLGENPPDNLVTGHPCSLRIEGG